MINTRWLGSILSDGSLSCSVDTCGGDASLPRLGPDGYEAGELSRPIGHEGRSAALGSGDGEPLSRVTAGPGQLGRVSR